MKQRKKGKYLTKFEAVPLRVIKVKGSAITIRKEGKEFTRNVSEMKKVNYPTCTVIDEEFDEIYEGKQEQDSELEDSEPEDEYLASSESEESDKDIVLRRSSRVRRPPEYLSNYDTD